MGPLRFLRVKRKSESIYQITSHNMAHEALDN